MYTMKCFLASVDIWSTTNSSDPATGLSSVNRTNETRDYPTKIQRPPARGVTQYTLLAKQNFTSGNIFGDLAVEIYQSYSLRMALEG